MMRKILAALLCLLLASQAFAAHQIYWGPASVQCLVP